MPTFLVTGAASGIGAELCERLLARGDRVIAAARRREQLNELAELGAQVVVMDVSCDESVGEAFASLRHLDGVIHCAAVAPLGTVEFTPAAKVAEVFNTNALGTLRVLQNSLPLLREAPSGRLLILSSVWGRVSGPFVSSYAASKHAIGALADAARREMIGQDVKISVIEPGVIRTRMYFSQLEAVEEAILSLGEKERALYAKAYEEHRELVGKASSGSTSVEECAVAILACLDARNPAPRIQVGADAKILVALGRLLSARMLDRIFGLIYKRT